MLVDLTIAEYNHILTLLIEDNKRNNNIFIKTLSSRFPFFKEHHTKECEWCGNKLKDGDTKNYINGEVVCDTCSEIWLVRNRRVHYKRRDDDEV